jgi:hypothetical protein
MTSPNFSRSDIRFTDRWVDACSRGDDDHRMSRKRDHDNINERFMAFTPVVLPHGHVVHAFTLYAPKKTACGKRMARPHVHFAREIDCIDCLASLFYKVTPDQMKRWLDRNKYHVKASIVEAVEKKKRRAK